MPIPAASAVVPLEHPAVLTRSHAIRLMGRGGFERALTSGAITRVARDSYCAAEHAQSWWTQLAVSLAIHGDGAAATGLAGLFLWGISDALPLPATVAVPVRHSVRRQVPGVRVCRTRMRSAIFSMRGLRVVEPEVALFRAMGELPERRRLPVALDALGATKVSLERLRQLVAEYPRAHGRTVVRRALWLHDDGVHSILEHDARRTVVAGEPFSRLQFQHDVVVRGTRFRFDAYDPDALLAIEFDGVRYHSDPQRLRHDRVRDVLVATLGIQTLRFLTDDVRSRPEWCRERILEVRARRLAQLGRGPASGAQISAG